MVAPITFFPKRALCVGPTRDGLTKIYSALVDAAKAKGTATPMGCAPMSSMKLSMMQGYPYKDASQKMFVLRGQLYLQTVKTDQWEKIGPVPLSAAGI